MTAARPPFTSIVGRSSSDHPLALFCVALVLRLAAVVAFDAPREAAGATPWQWGAEEACLADSLVRGEGFGDPWAHGTGPSAWLTPVYPALVAACLRLGGGVTPLAAWSLFALQCVFDALTAVLLVRLGRNLGRPAAGALAGWLWAFYPLAVWHAAQTVWDTTLVAFALTLFLERFTRLAFGESAVHVVLAGAFFGLLLFLNPAPQSIAPVVFAALLVGRGDGSRCARRAAHAVLFTASALAVCLPWIVRNQRVLGTWQLRPNYGVELMIGNHAHASGHPEPFKYHPSHVEAERARYRELGEVAYGRGCFERALTWMRAEPAAFAALTAKRVELFWLGRPPPFDPRQSAGLGAENDPKSWLKWIVFALVGLGGWLGLVCGGLGLRTRLFVAALWLAFGLPYYLSHVSERYRFPIDPLLIFALACGLERVLHVRRSRRTTGAAGV